MTISLLAAGTIGFYISGILLFFVSLFLILLVLVQRGRGGGLTGALGGAGGQSAFGAKAGDTFTKVTMWTALVWILLCVLTIKFLNTQTIAAPGGPSVSSPKDGEGDKDKDKDKDKDSPGVLDASNGKGDPPKKSEDDKKKEDDKKE